MDFFSNFAKYDESKPSDSDKHQKQSNFDIFNSARNQAGAEEAHAQFDSEPEKYDKGKLPSPPPLQIYWKVHRIKLDEELGSMLIRLRISPQATTLYVTLEPCPMCAGAILQARIDTVVWGAPNKLLGADGSWIRLFPSGDEENRLDQTDKPPAPIHPFHPNITIRRGVLASECADAMQQFFQLRRKKKNNKLDPPTPPSYLPITHRPMFLTKIHDAFHIMFCL